MLKMNQTFRGQPKTMNIPKNILAGQHEITKDYLSTLDTTHLLDIVEGRTTKMFEIKRPCEHFAYSPHRFKQYN